MVGNTPIEKCPEYVQYGLIRLSNPGERILFDGTPFYVGQTVATTQEPDATGIVTHIHLNAKSKEPYIHCDFDGKPRILKPRSLSIPIVGALELEQRGDDFFDSLHIGDAIDEEIRENLYYMLPRLVEKPDYFQLSGVVGTASGYSGRMIPTYLTVKRFGGAKTPWRYIGHCERGDDVHLFTHSA
jgi:hypothetical protein